MSSHRVHPSLTTHTKIKLKSGEAVLPSTQDEDRSAERLAQLGAALIESQRRGRVCSRCKVSIRGILYGGCLTP